MKAVKETVRKYYKYVYTDFEQPTLTENGTMGGSSFACNQSSTYSTYYAYLAFSSSSMWHSAEAIPAWISWYNPKPLKISKLSFKVGNSSDYPDLPKQYLIQGSNDNTTWTTVYSATNTSTSPIPLSINIDLSSVENNIYKYWRYYVSSVLGRNFGNMRNMTITAQEQTIAEGTSTDYDYYEDVEVYKLPAETVRKYYKTVENITQFSQPTLSSNGTVGGNSFAVTYTGGIANDGQPWKAFDGNQSTWWLSNNNSPATLTFYNPLPLNVTNIYITVGWPNDYAYVKAGIVKGSNDGSNWTDIVSWSGGTDYYNIVMSSNKSYYKYHQLYCTASSYVSHMSIGECKITATQKESITNESTIEDYTYYKDFYIYKAFNC